MELYYISKEQISDVGCTSVLWQDMKYAIFENLSTTTKIESLPFLDLGKHKIKSIEILTQGALGTGKGVHNSCGKTLDLAYLQVMQRSVLLSLFIFGQKKMFM